MSLKRMDNALERLKSIIAYKKNVCQNKLDYLEKKREIEKIVLKYSNNPLRGLIELDVDEINVLLTYFIKEKYALDDLKMKKYWMQEAEMSPSLYNTDRYKEASALFIKLMDKLQEYLDNLKDTDIDPNEIEKELALLQELSDKLENQKIISDLEVYMRVIKPSETITPTDTCEFFIALALTNIGKKVEDSSKKVIDEDIKQYLITLLHNVINSSMPINTDNYDSEVINTLDEMLLAITNDYTKILDYYPVTLEEILNKISDQQEVSTLIDHLRVPVTVIRGQQQGLELAFNDEDTNIITSFLTLLQTKKDALMKKYNHQDNVTDDLTTCVANIIDKLEGRLNEDFKEEEFYALLELLIDDNKTSNYIIGVINLLNRLNLGIISLDKPVEEVKPLHEETIGEAENNSIAKLFITYGYDYDNFPSTILDKISKHMTYLELEQKLKYLSEHPELDFIKPQHYNLEITSLDKKIKETSYSRFYLLLVYSNKDILDDLLSLVQETNLSLKDIFAVPKVYISIDDNGTYEHFLKNIRLIRYQYPTILNKLVKRAPSVLGTDSDLFRKNIDATEAYGMHIDSDKEGAFPSPRALASSKFEYVMDHYIELGEFDYIERFRSQLETNYEVALRFRYLQVKQLDIKKHAYFDIESYFNHQLYDYLKDASIENIAVGINDDLVKWLDSINMVSKEHQNICYLLDGVYISRLKTLKYYSTMLINGYANKKKALLYSMVKDSFLTEKEFTTLKNLLKGDA